MRGLHLYYNYFTDQGKSIQYHGAPDKFAQNRFRPNTHNGANLANLANLAKNPLVKNISTKRTIFSKYFDKNIDRLLILQFMPLSAQNPNFIHKI